MTALRCRVEIPPGDDCFAPGGICGQPAAIGIITETVEDHVHDGHPDPDPILQLFPVCVMHAPEQVHEHHSSMDAAELAVITLAYGTSAGGLT